VKALLVRLSAIGDVVHTLPALAALRAAGHRAGWAVEPAARALLLGNPALEAVAPVPASRGFRFREATAALRVLRAGGYDVALDFQGLWKSAAWARLSGARRVIGYAGPHRREPASALLVGERAALPVDAVHVIDKNLALLRTLGIEAVGSRAFPLPDTAPESRRVERELAGLGLRDFAVLNPGGGWASKLWPAERFAALAARLRALGLRSIVTWGPGEEGLAERVAAASDGAAVRSFPTTLLEYLEIARRARLVVAADTGTLHLACALGTPVVGLFGPTDPARNGPFAALDRTVRRVPPCAPCHRRVCSTHLGIMQAIPVDEVAAAAEARLAAGSREEGARRAV
jgi:ADP-heptose:LPS heptosyltransferase